MFFVDDSGAHYPVARIERIGLPETDNANTGSWSHSVRLTGGQEVVVRGREIHRVLGHGTALPAQPGYYVIHVDSDDVAEALRIPIVGWLVGSDGSATPITPDGVNDGVETILCVLTPEGLVIRPNDQTWGNLEAFVKDPGRPGFS